MWYKTGTINLIANNATVTGTGTAWADAKFGVMPGMILLAPDNKLYEVKQVNSNTSLTLNSNYAGSTANGQSYAIITTYEGDISQFSARFAAMLTFFQGSRNDTVSWFTGSGDMTFTKDDGTKLTVPTLAKVQADYVSRSSTLDQSIVSSVLFSKPVRLSTSSNATGFIPTSQGAWVSWNRKTSADDGLTGATDFITHKGAFQGGWNFWSSNGTTADLSARISAAGYLTTAGGVNSTGDQIMQAGSTTPNLLLRFRDAAGIEKGAVYSDTSTGQMTIRWGGASHSLIGKVDGQLNVPRTLTFNSVHSQPTDVPDVSNLPVIFRGHDTASFDRPNNFSIGTWFGFSIVPTGGNEILGPGVERGKPVFFVNSRAGTAHVLNNLYVGAKAVIKVGDYGLGGSAQHQDDTLQTVGRMYRVTGSSLNRPGAENNYSALSIPMSGTSPATVGYLFVSETGKLRTGISNQASGSAVNTYGVWGDYNTTVDANGFLKKASPIARLSSNPEKMPDEYLDGFTLSGLAAVNGEAAGVTAERVSVGVYKVTGSLGFALEGWNIEVPQDVNGNRLCFVATEAAEDGTITVKVSKRRFDIDTAAIVAGEPMDIPEGRWIDLRLEMPPVEEVQSEPEPESHEGEMASE
ncbi:Uncharacterised protein [Serratia fonticola]|uniref:phage tail fiber protein n=1 Tax=Serratia fonticola TaxID=47917 RepID=UPI002183C194|nr:hypothetical protein [Serratia fonticola]CAI2104376.1 Uncharacterised protein [Serratia fonticola]